MHSSKVGTVDKAGRAADITGSASDGARSTDHIVADTADSVGAVNIADTVGAESHPRMDHSSRGHMPEPEGCGRLRRARVAALSSPRKKFSLDRPPRRFYRY